VKKSMIFTSCILGLLVSSHVQALSLSDVLGADQTAVSAHFDRYEFNTETGDLSGPFPGSFTLQRPGLMSITTNEGAVTLQGDQLAISFCERCKPISTSAYDFISKDLLALIQTGANLNAFFEERSRTKQDNGMIQINYSLHGLSDTQASAVLFGYGNQPTVLELSLKPKQKTILQFSDIKTQSVSVVGEKQ
jgi:outer membrane lipoprotein-sorting protein